MVIIPVAIDVMMPFAFADIDQLKGGLGEPRLFPVVFFLQYDIVWLVQQFIEHEAKVLAKPVKVQFFIVQMGFSLQP